MTVILTAAVCAVAAGARSFVAVAEWAADLPAELTAVLGVDRGCPSESAIRRLIERVDADRFDAVIGAFLQTLTAAVAPAGRRRVLAVDGKDLRGSRHIDTDGAAHPGRHLLAVIDHRTRTVLGQVRVAGKTNEITAFAPLLDTLTSIDLTGVVITADALHTQREHVTDLHQRGAHWVLSVKGNQPRLRRQLAALPLAGGADIAPQRRDRAWAREIRTLKVVTIAAGIEFPHAAQAIQVPSHPPGVRARRAARTLAHRDRVRHYRPARSPGPTRRTRGLDPRALADRGAT